MYLLGRVGFVMDINEYPLPNCRAQQRAGKLTVVSSGCDAAARCQLNLSLADAQDVGWVGRRRASFGSARELEARTGRRKARKLKKGAPSEEAGCVTLQLYVLGRNWGGWEPV